MMHRFLALALLAVAVAACEAPPMEDGAAQSVGVAVSPPAAQVSPSGSVSFSAVVTGSAVTDVVWTVQEGAAGGTVDATGLYRAPTGSGVFHVVATAAADSSRKGTATVTVSTPPPPDQLAIATGALPGGTTGSPYAAALAATGGTPPYSWSVSAGSLPAGLSLASATGALSGTPSAVGTATFTVRVTDAASGAATAPLGITVVAPSPIDLSILPAELRTTWDPGIPGGVPRDDDPVRPATVWLPAGNPYLGYSVNPALTGTSNAAAFTSALQAAIDAAGAAASPTNRRIVRVKAGTYYVAPQFKRGGSVGIVIQVDNVTLRGDGADTTRLAANGTIHDYGSVVLLGHRSPGSEAGFLVRDLAATGAKGSNTVQLSSAAGYAVGDVVTLDKQDGPAVATGAAMINGGYIWFYDAQYFKRAPGFTWVGPGTGAPGLGSINNLTSANQYAQSAVPQWRSTSQTNEIVAISGNTVTLRDPLHLDFPLSTHPQFWLTVPANTGSGVGNRWVGIEDIAVAGGNNEWGFPGGTIAFSYVAYGWARNVEADGERWSGDPSRPGKYGYNIGIGRSYRVIVRDSYVHGSADQNPGGQAYGIVVGVGSSACLVENNISVENNKPIALNVTGGGNVISYNYVDEAVLWNSPGWQENAIDDCHASFTHHDLIEGNWTPNLGSDSTHGNSGWHVHLRNYASGRNSGGASSNLRAVGMDGWTHWHAYVGNILKGGSVYQTTPTSQGGGTPVYQLGNLWGGNWGNWDNGYSAAHIFRDGNWDNVTNGVVWASGARSIPSSFYLTAKPAFFGARAWPWVDPLTGAASVLPAKARYDAGTPNVVP
jgi:hypothetical protein